ncbi:hypothetical protein [Streptomyces sp. NPDC006012]|uniref:hypothetical protein n=1 Tax=Streptomyces sp. NPDC006012 TaxID=3364739 RepID=UPI00368CAB03
MLRGGDVRPSTTLDHAVARASVTRYGPGASAGCGDPERAGPGADRTAAGAGSTTTA